MLWGKFWQLRWPERRLLIQALLMLPGVAIGLRLWGFKRVQTLLGSRWLSGNQRSLDSVAAVGQALTTARLVKAAAHRGPYHGNCLKQALTLWWLLHRQGICGDLRIGARLRNGQLEAHAWVEYQGVPLLEPADLRSQFAAFEDH